MSLGHGATVVRDGLVLHLDAANPKSYPGSGTTWYDLSGRGNHRTMVNGPLYVGGGILHDGVDDYTLPSPSIFTDAECEGSLTYEYWIEPAAAINSFVESTTGTSYFSPGTPQGLAGTITYKYNNQAYAAFMFAFGTNGFVAGAHNNGYAPPILADYHPFPGISHLIVVKNTYSCSYFINGQFKKTSQTISKILGDTLDRISATNQSSYFGRYFKGKIYVARFYNRALSAAEIKQNFEALRGRYGI